MYDIRRRSGEGAVRNIQGRIGELLALVGLYADDGLNYPHQFSGGHRLS
jgi:ABC-type oligopeptide transport system ATPase subunit